MAAAAHLHHNINKNMKRTVRHSQDKVAHSKTRSKTSTFGLNPGQNIELKHTEDKEEIF